jgi:hypothetical protein
MIQKRFTYEQIAFDYSLALESRKTIAIHIWPDQSVRVKAPLHATESKITGFLQRKILWILKHQRYFAQFKPRAPKEYISGETFRYLGRNYKLLIRKAEGQERVSLQHGVLTVFSLSPHDRAHTKILLDGWYLEKARNLFADRLTACLNRFPQSNLPKLGIRRLVRRWGSYSSRTHRIGLNLELIKATRSQIDYVLLHELCHITHRAHDKAFYRLLGSHLPDWKVLKAELERSLLSV